MGFGSFLSSGFGDPISALFGNNGLFSNPSGAWDQFRNGRTNEVNQNIANQNLQFQRENLDYQKALQQKIFEREDTAYQRTVNDMRSAGLSPLAMNGTNGAGEAIQTEPLHNDFQHQESMSPLAAVSQIGSLVNQFRSSSAQIDNLNAQTEGVKYQNSVAPLDFATRITNSILQSQNLRQDIKNKTANYGLTMLQTLNQKYQNDDYKNFLDFANKLGISSHMDDKQLYWHYFKSFKDKGYLWNQLPVDMRNQLDTMMTKTIPNITGAINSGSQKALEFINEAAKKFYEWKNKPKDDNKGFKINPFNWF